MKDRPSKKDCQTALVAGWCWLAVVIIALLCSCNANGSQPVGAAYLQPAVCRITNTLNSANNIGSGTLIDKTDDGREGLVLTCAHLFRDGTGEVLVKFATGQEHVARVIDIDQQADLAALAIAHPKSRPAEVTLTMNEQARLHACGYGPRGIYRCAVGRRVGQAASAGQMSLLIGDPVRSGDSGGGVFDEQGRLVAVIWGEAQGVTYASYGQPLRRFINRILGRRTSVVYSCPNGVCPQRPQQPTLPSRANLPTSDHRWGEFQKQLDELRAQKQDRGDYLTRSEMSNFGGFARHEDFERLETEVDSRHATLLERLQSLSGRTVGKAAGTAAVGLLGLSGPAGWAMVAASSIGGWLIGRKMKRQLRKVQDNGAGGRRQDGFHDK